MEYYNSKDRNYTVDFQHALMQGLAPGGGLFCPAHIPDFQTDHLNDILKSDRITLATEILFPFVQPALSREDLHQILTSSINFDIPLKPITNQVSILELFHGPTEAFKDVGARFMARCMAHFLGDQKLTILVATSGDTGSAVADGFWRVDGIDVIVLFPKDGVSPYQEGQMTTLGHNITAVEIEGTFDDCQDLVKRAFQDNDITGGKKLSSANSINIGRLLPQMLYYFFAAQQVASKDRSTYSICVPSGNFGNITSGLYGHRAGLQFGQFIAATNANTTFPEYLSTGLFEPRPSVKTLSNAMDVGKPSNFVRIAELFEQDQTAMSQLIKSIGISDQQTVETIRDVHAAHDYLLDPHAAVGWRAMEELDPQDKYHHIILGTAHPRKFEAAVHQALPEVELTFPRQTREKQKSQLPNNYDQFKEFVINN